MILCCSGYYNWFSTRRAHIVRVKLTSIIITHRITTAKEVDKIIVLENGVVSEIGTHEQLSKQAALYKQLWIFKGS